MNSLLHTCAQMAEKVKLSKYLVPVFESTGPHSHFFGYYYNNPLDSKAEKLLSHRTSFDGRELQSGDEAEVGYFTLTDQQWHGIGTTEAFNWQDGAMLQWVPGREGVVVVYNLLIDGVARGRKVNIETGEELILEKPIYAVHPSGKWAIGVNFSRLAVCRPSYGYRESSEIINFWQGSIHPDDGFFEIDLQTGKSSLLMTTAAVAAIEPRCDASSEALHYLQHPMWNPDGSRFIFLHRYTTENGSFKTRLFSASHTGDALYKFPDAALYSHAAWKDPKTFAIWMNPGGGLIGSYAKHRQAGAKWLLPIRFCLRLGRKIFKSSHALQRIQKNGYYELEDQATNKKTLAHGSITIDGHPTYFNHGKSLLTDTYQDENNFRHLLWFGIENKSIVTLASFYSPYNNCGYRCDLHPRIDQRGKFVCIDSAHTGQRQLSIYRFLI